MRRKTEYKSANIGKWGSVPLAAFGRLTKLQLAIFAVVASFRGKDGICRPSLDAIAARLLADAGIKMSVKAISKHISRLKSLGWLGVARRGWGKSNNYTLLNPVENHGEYVKTGLQNGDMHSPQRDGDIDSPQGNGESNTKTPSNTPYVTHGNFNWFDEALARHEAGLQAQASLLAGPDRPERVDDFVAAAGVGA